MSKKVKEAVKVIESLDDLPAVKPLAEVVYYGEAKAAQLGVGVDLLGSKTSLVAGRGNQLLVTNIGIEAISGRNGRKLTIPYANIKAFEWA